MTLLVYNGIDGNSILQPSGYYGTNWPSRKLVIPELVSAGGWTIDNQNFDHGYPQQTFLGASIRSFSMNGGFGDSSSTLSVELVNDEFNVSDLTMEGFGDDPYHSGRYGDRFAPPIAGTPVFFKFGPNLATVEEAYRKTFDLTYGYSTSVPRSYSTNGTFNVNSFTSLSPNNFVDLESNTIYDLTSYNTNTMSKGSDHIVFGGILQSYVQNRGTGANPVYSVDVVDPREILSNVVLILNDYAGSSYGTQNIYNIYGFLEHNMTPATSGSLQSYYPQQNILTKSINNSGVVSFSGSLVSPSSQYPYPLDSWIKPGASNWGNNTNFQAFPITGTGFSRRSQQGIPAYRVGQALYALMSVSNTLPEEYARRGFGSVINFRGHNYVVDFSGLPNVPAMYYLDFDQINLLDLALEICEVTSRDLFVSLLPVINHPACEFLYNQNNQQSLSPTNPKFISGIIRLDAIDRSIPPTYGSIKQYIDNLASQNIYVENQDVGYELSNVTTDKFVVGAQEIDLYFFSSLVDRGMKDFYNTERSEEDNTDESFKQWGYSDGIYSSLIQQIIPYYGNLGQNAVTIPRGWGAYKQILLDTTGLNAKGVGSYYVATEMELRCAAVSFDCWKSFLQQYNDTYLESSEDDDTYEGAALDNTPNFSNVPPTILSNNYVVTVPRSVFMSYAKDPFISGTDLPSSPCNPPFGYPLYYKRMTQLGIPEGGLTKLGSRLKNLITAGATIRGATGDNYAELRTAIRQEIDELRRDGDRLTPNEQAYCNALLLALQSTPPNIALISNAETALHQTMAVLPRLAKKGTENALKVYNFLKKIADENLGKKFLVRLPSRYNARYQPEVSDRGFNGPFGFKPRSINSDMGGDRSPSFASSIAEVKSAVTADATNNPFYFLNSGLIPEEQNAPIVGGLVANFNPISNQYVFNYTPMNDGGYYNFDLYQNTLSYKQLSSIPSGNRPSGIKGLLIPQDLTNFLNDQGRISPYVRFNHSQYLDFKEMNSDDFTQQLITQNGMIPDLCEFLDNTSDTNDENLDFSNANNANEDNEIERNLPHQCAFVKCSVDEKLYMPPKMSGVEVKVYGNAEAIPKVSRPRKIWVPCSGWSSGPGSTLVPGTGVYIDSMTYVEYFYKPLTTVQKTINDLHFIKKFEPALNSYIIDADYDNLNTDFVFALITLPNKVSPTKDARFRDAVHQKNNAYNIHHYLTMDVVKHSTWFNTPAYMAKASSTNIGRQNCDLFTAETRSIAWLASKAAKSQLQFGFPTSINFVEPSPVYPDIVALPLMSHERCYGPWISSQVDPQGAAITNIGGRVEFIKDENLSPWNYSGYDLLNEAGIAQAQFANSLFLFSERGGFVVPGLPRVSLCQVLLAGGPLVTNVSVDVSDAGLKTTVKMDLYSSSFGKLQKQKQDMISKISRERQRLRSERNALIRKGLGKAQTSNATNIVGRMNNYGTLSISQTSQRPATHIVASVQQYEMNNYSPTLAGNSSASPDLFGDDDPPPGLYVTSEYSHAASFQNMDMLSDTANTLMDMGDIAYNNAMMQAGGIELTSMFKPYDNMPNIYMPNKNVSRINSANAEYLYGAVISGEFITYA